MHTLTKCICLLAKLHGSRRLASKANKRGYPTSIHRCPWHDFSSKRDVKELHLTAKCELLTIRAVKRAVCLSPK